jgi:ribonuclease-3
LCAAFEALVGALYLDQGKGAAEELIEPLVAPEVARILREHSDKDDKSRLQELVQGQLRCTPRYVTVQQSGPDHAKEFTVEVTINGEIFGRGVGHSKQQAAQKAAQEALARFDAMASETSSTDPEEAATQESG